MKRILGIFCALTLAALSLFSTSAYDKAFQKGDADLDGRISIGDATLIQRYIAELGESDGFWSFFAADYDNNGVINIHDVSSLQRTLAQFDSVTDSIPDGNATIAQAAATLCYPRYGDGVNARGKQIYRDVYDLTIGIDEYMTACNRFVCAAVRWSGADDNYPAGDVGVQADYLYAHPEKWESVYGDTFLRGEDYRYAPPEGMQPGDVVIEYKATNYRAHTFIYCGEGLIATIYPAYSDNEYVSANASWGDNMPQCTGWYRWQPYFRVFRCKQYDTNSRYKNAAL